MKFLKLKTLYPHSGAVLSHLVLEETINAMRLSTRIIQQWCHRWRFRMPGQQTNSATITTSWHLVLMQIRTIKVVLEINRSIQIILGQWTVVLAWGHPKRQQWLLATIWEYSPILKWKLVLILSRVSRKESKKISCDCRVVRISVQLQLGKSNNRGWSNSLIW